MRHVTTVGSGHGFASEPNGEYWTRLISDDFLCHTPEQEVAQTSMSVDAHNDKINPLLTCYT